MKRIFIITTIAALLLLSFAGCSKKNKTGNDLTPTGSVDPNNPGNDDDPNASVDFITLGGYFSRDDANLVIFISNNGWNVNGILFPKDENASPLILSGPLTYKEGLDLNYSKDGEEITFTFAKNSMTVKTTKGNTYTAFDGSYKREEEIVAADGSIPPKSGSTLELIGRIAVTHYMAQAEGIPACTIDLSSGSFDNAYMTEFTLKYADLFLASEAVPAPEISVDYLYYAFSETDLNNLFLTATAGKFGTNGFETAGSDIVYKDGTYYIPCYGNFAAGLATSYTAADPDVISDRLLLEAAVTKKGGGRYDMEMTLSTSENAGLGAAGIQINSVTYELTK